MQAAPLEPPSIDSDDDYRSLLGDIGFWAPFVGAALRAANLPIAERLQSGTPGTYPTFLTDGGLVVKLHGDRWCGPESFAAELAAHRLIDRSDLPVPRLVASGELWPMIPAKCWRYLITTAVPGVPLANWEGAPEQRRHMAADLGVVFAKLHRTRLVRDGRFGADGGYSRSRLREGRLMAPERQRKWGHLTPEQCSQVSGFLDSRWDQVEDLSSITFLHGDLHEDHVFVDEAGHVTGIIDFGDSLAGDPHLDIVPVHLGSFHGDLAMLESFLRAYSTIRPGSEWPGLMMVLTLVNEFDVLDGWPMLPRPGASLSKLANDLWGGRWAHRNEANHCGGGVWALLISRGESPERVRLTLVGPQHFREVHRRMLKGDSGATTAHHVHAALPGARAVRRGVAVRVRWLQWRGETLGLVPRTAL
ncbi:MAG: phosphotransferase family protein [Candidatus Dormibacteria bacterium]